MLMLLLLFFSVILLATYNIYRYVLSRMIGICTCKTRMNDKTVIITGSNTGIGYETAKNLAERGAKIILACRNVQKATVARDKIIMDTGNKNIIVKYLDLRSFKSIRIFAAGILKTESKLDVLINNAGSLDSGPRTRDLLPSIVQVNYFSPFLLTMLLLPLLKKSAPSRIINVSSDLHRRSKLNVTTYHKPADPSYSCWNAFPDMNLAIILFTNRLSIELEGTGVTANSLSPGLVYTNIFCYRATIVKCIFKLLMKTPLQGAQTTIHLAVCPNLSRTTGIFFSDCRRAWMSARARNTELANMLWELSEKIVFNKQNILKMKKKKKSKRKHNY